MSVVTSLTATPSRIQALLGTCAALGGRAARAELDQLISPKSLRPVGRQGEDGDESAATEEVISECRQFGFVGLDGPAVELTPRGAAAATDLLSEVSPLLTELDLARAHGQAEFPFLLCWLLMQDPYAPIPWGDAPALDVRRAIGADDDLARIIPKNVAGFQQFHYWARYLGFSEWVRSKGAIAVVAVPTATVRRAITSAGMGSGTVTTAQAFVSSLGRACPVLDGGSTREQVERSGKAQTYQAGHSVSESLGLAIKTLVAMGELELDEAADADRMVLVPASQGQTETFSHVRIA